jgi:chemosensory pili system protein ChpA (sensor histidine kinase/response regulator)
MVIPESKVVGGLNWVKGELVETLRRVRGQIEAFAADGAQADVSEAVAALHESRGVLLALGLTAPARLVQEVQCLLERLAAGSLTNTDEAAEALMLALIQLPHHLDRLDAGQPESPASLLPSINDLRFSRGARPLAASDLAVTSSALAQRELPTSEGLKNLAGLAAKIRPHYHRHLLQALHEDGDQGLIGLRNLFNQLHQFFRHGVVSDTFRAADALVAGILSRAIKVNPGIKAILGHVDTIFKPLLAPVPEWPEAQARHLIDESLVYLRDLRPKPQLVVELEAEYGSHVAVEAPPDLAGPSHRGVVWTDALGALVEEVLRELGQVEDGLDLFVRGDADGPDQLAPMEHTLRQLGNTLAIGNDPDLVDRIHGLADQIGSVVRSQARPDDAVLLGFARDLLAVEDTLRLVAPGSEGAGRGAEGLLVGTLREARVDLAKAKQAIGAYALEPGDVRKLHDAADVLPGVGGALQVLGEQAAANVIQGVGDILRRRYGQGGQLPDTADLELIAEAISGVDLYMEDLAEGGVFGANMLAQAESAMEALTSIRTGIVRNLTAPAPVSAVAAEALVTPEETALEKAGLKQVTPAPVLGSEPTATAAVPDLAAETKEISEPIDPEFLDIFLEEAREEAGKIDESLARWARDTQDRDALVTLRRSFHTLKGSGRLVGAIRMAEVAAATEALLNSVIDGALAATGPLVAQVSAVAAAVPGLIEAEAAALPVDVEPLVLRTTALFSPQPAILAASPEIVFQTPQAPATEPAPPVAVEMEVIDADQELLDIFIAEARDHLATLSAFLSNGVECVGLPVEPGVLRALHTLSGSSRMTGVGSIAGVSGALDRLCNDLNACGLVVDLDLSGLLARACDALSERLDRLPASGPEVPVLAAVALEATQWTERLAATVAGLSTEPERGLEVLAESEEVAYPSLETEAEPVGFEANAEPEPEAVGLGVSEQVEREAVGLEVSAEAAVEPVWPEAQAELEPGAGAVIPPSQRERESDRVPAVVSVADASTSAAPVQEAAGLDPELTALFLEDARDILDGLDKRLREWQLDPQATEPLQAIQRLLHTLKGSARLSSLTAIANLSHALESTLSAIAKGETTVDEDALELAQRSLDTLSNQVDAVEQGTAIPTADALVAALSGGPQLVAPVKDEELERAGLPQVERAAPGVTPVVPAEAGTRRGPAAPVAQIRVRADVLNRLVNNSGEISIYRSRLAQQNGTLRSSLGELEQTVGRLREQLRHLEIETEAQIIYRFDREVSEADLSVRHFDPLELDRFSTLQQLSRSISETVNDLVSLKTQIADLERGSADLLVQQARIAEDLQDGLLRTRMVPFVQAVPRLQRLVRQAAQALEKRVALNLRGPEVELDRGILDRLVPALEHLLRNAVAHGIERPEARLAAGKAAEGVVVLSLVREGNDVLIAIKDDGAGMNLAAIRRRALERGLIHEGVDVAEDQLLQLAMAPGFSTVDQVDQIAGRGVGLDVVASEVKRLSGTLTLASRPGQGAEFVIRLPLTLAIVDALLAKVGNLTHAIPIASVEAVARVPRDDMAKYHRGLTQDFHYQGQNYRVMHLGKLLDPTVTPELGEQRWQPLLLVRTADQRLALSVDSMVGTQRIVVKPLGPQLSTIGWLNGGTILPDGRVALIIDLLALARSPAVQAYRAVVAKATQRQRACVMVVDDSLTVRRVTERLLRRQNMDVLSAKDGVDALTQLEERIPDLILLDVEMPRMDGYELTRHIRRSPQLSAIPIIMITSRTGEKHRHFAMELGVNRYLGKPYQEAELLDEISAVLMDAPA